MRTYGGTVVGKRRSTLRDLDADQSMGDFHNERRPKDLDNHDSAAPRYSTGDLIRLTRMRSTG